MSCVPLARPWPTVATASWPSPLPPSCLNSRNVFPTIRKLSNSKIRRWPVWLPVRILFRLCQTAALLLRPLVAFLCLLFQGHQSHSWRLSPPNLIPLEAPPPNAVTLGVRFQSMNQGDRSIQGTAEPADLAVSKAVQLTAWKGASPRCQAGLGTGDTDREPRSVPGAQRRRQAC